MDENLLQQIPAEGYPLELLEQALNNTPEEPMAIIARWSQSEYNNVFLDEPNHPDYIDYIDSPWTWDPEDVAFLTGEWQTADRIIQEINRFMNHYYERLHQLNGMLSRTLKRIAQCRPNTEEPTL